MNISGRDCLRPDPARSLTRPRPGHGATSDMPGRWKTSNPDRTVSWDAVRHPETGSTRRTDRLDVSTLRHLCVSARHRVAAARPSLLIDGPSARLRHTDGSVHRLHCPVPRSGAAGGQGWPTGQRLPWESRRRAGEAMPGARPDQGRFMLGERAGASSMDEFRASPSWVETSVGHPCSPGASHGSVRF